MGMWQDRIMGMTWRSDGRRRTFKNRIALENLRFYVSVRVDDIVIHSEVITARKRLSQIAGLFLRTGAESVATLNMQLTACKYQQGRNFLSGWRSWIPYTRS